MRIGFYGGSFDPVHLAHLLLAETCREQHQLDRVVFIPAGIPPHKLSGCRTSPEDRYRMLRLATDGHPQFEVSRFEIDRTDVSYTVDTLRHFQAQEPDAELFFIMGADMLLDLPHWYEAAEVCRRMTPIATRRPNSPELDFDALATIVPDRDRRERFAEFRVDMPQLELSSTDIRDRIAAGQTVRYRIPRAVEQYILTHRLYV